MKKAAPKPTETQFAALQACFDYFNKALFENRLPECILNLSRFSKAEGFFAPNRWSDEKDENGQIPEGVDLKHEISLNPEWLSQNPEWVMSVLVHEMCHLERQITGKPPRKLYHDKKWAEMMVRVGLTPFNIKDPSKMTGQSCRHHLDEGGGFKAAYKAMDKDILLPFIHVKPGLKLAKKSPSKTKFTCPECDANVWGKPDVQVGCWDCQVKMLAEGEEPANEEDENENED